MRQEVADWFARRTWQPAPWTVADLVAAKSGRTVSVVLPALNEEGTVGHVVEAVATLTRRAGGAPALVDELVVVDGGSSDRTAERARAAGARVVDRATALPGVEVRPGKGEVLWRALAATSGDLVVFVDADLVDVDPGVVVGLLGPLLTVDGVLLVKGFYRRPLRLETIEYGTGGGRVTELVARPLLARFAPELAGVIQPLGGESAATRELLESLPFAGGYGVEIGLLMDTAARHGLDTVAQVDLGVRKHRNRTLLQLGVMSQQVLATVLARAGVDPADGGGPVELVQYGQRDGRWEARPASVEMVGRPPMRGSGHRGPGRGVAPSSRDPGPAPDRARRPRAGRGRGGGGDHRWDRSAGLLDPGGRAPGRPGVRG
jgi:glucosyl-3-phosphoglycerate synthase